MTTINRFLKASLMSRRIKKSTRYMCPVLEMGSHSVTPSTIPRKMTLSISKKLISMRFSRLDYAVECLTMTKV